MKLMWGRVRFRELVDPYADFTPWYLPQFFNYKDTYKDPTSFPSGHTANAAVMIMLVLLPDICPALKGKRCLMIAIAAVWTVLVAISRIVVGAHFVSDVTTGAAITVVLFFFISFLVNKRFKYQD